MEQQKRLKFTIRYDPYLHTLNGILFDYLRQYRRAGFSTKERILKAVSAYWLPMAVDWAGKDEDEVKKLAYSSVYQLQLQIHHLQQVFNLSDSVRIINSPSQSVINGTESNRPERVESEVDSEPSPEFEERIDFAEDEDFLKHFEN